METSIKNYLAIYQILEYIAMWHNLWWQKNDIAPSVFWIWAEPNHFTCTNNKVKHARIQGFIFQKVFSNIQRNLWFPPDHGHVCISLMVDGIKISISWNFLFMLPVIYIKYNKIYIKNTRKCWLLRINMCTLYITIFILIISILTLSEEYHSTLKENNILITMEATWWAKKKISCVIYFIFHHAIFRFTSSVPSRQHAIIDYFWWLSTRLQ